MTRGPIIPSQLVILDLVQRHIVVANQILLRQRCDSSRGIPAALYRRIVFGAPADGVMIPAHWLDRRPRYDDTAVRAHFQRYLLSLQQRYPDNVEDQVREIIGQLLPTGECRVERVAATLGLHPRVLQKRLQRQGSSYVVLLQEVRMSLAQQHLRQGAISITDLALNRGYAEVSIFSRKFKAVTGSTPRDFAGKSQ